MMFTSVTTRESIGIGSFPHEPREEGFQDRGDHVVSISSRLLAMSSQPYNLKFCRPLLCPLTLPSCTTNTPLGNSLPSGRLLTAMPSVSLGLPNLPGFGSIVNTKALS